jgi:hypothetical protein
MTRQDCSRLTVEVFPRRLHTGRDPSDTARLIELALAVFHGGGTGSGLRSIFLGVEDGRVVCRVVGHFDPGDAAGFQSRVRALEEFAFGAAEVRRLEPDA